MILCCIPGPPERCLDLRVFWSDATISVLEDMEKVTYVDNRFPVELNLSSIASCSVDYYFIYGPIL